MSNSMATNYCREIKHQLGSYFGTWLPNAPVNVGDYGTVEDRIFTSIGNVGSLGCKVEVATGEPTHLHFTSTSGVTVKHLSSVDANVPSTKIEAGLEIAFSKQDGIFFNAAESVVKRITNSAQIESTLLKLTKANKWKKDWVVVTGVVSTGATTIAISKSDRASITLRAKGNFAEIDLANASVNLQIEATSNIGLQLIAEKGLVPLMQLSQLQTPLFFGDTTLAPRTYGVIGIDRDELVDVFTHSHELKLVELV